MTILRSEDFEAFLKTKSAKMNGLLLHGNDAEAVGVLARQASRALVGKDNAQSSVLNLDLGIVKENPSKVVDEFNSLSLLGDRQVIIVDGVDDNFLKFVAPVLNSTSVANFVLLSGGNLGKSSKLRVACEQSLLVASLAIYQEDQAAIAARLRRQLAENGLQWLGDAEEVFFARAGLDRASVNQELAKLVLYCWGQKEISEEDVDAICGDTSSFGTDDLIDAMLQGDLVRADRMASGFDGDQRTILIVLLNHLSRLQSLRAEIETGGSVESVLRAARPPIFFKRQNAIKSQIKNFDLKGLISLQDQVSVAILQTRKLPDIADAITNRTLLSIARSASSRLN